MKIYICVLFASLFVLNSCGDTVSQQQEPESNTEISHAPTENKDTSLFPSNIPPNTPSFTEYNIDIKHLYDDTKALAFLGGAFFDLDSDGKNEFIITAGADQEDSVFRYIEGNIVDITSQTGIGNSLPSYGVYAIDFDENGYDDLFIARQDGIYFYENNSGFFTEKKLDISLPQNAVPLDIDFADIDGDRDLDMYVSTFITQTLFRSAVFNDQGHIQKNLLLQNDGDLNFIDISSESGLHVTTNTFTSSFVDLDNDLDPDIIISPNTDTVKIYENTDGKFSKIYEGALYGFWMGLAVSDVDNDGDSDIFFSNVGTSIPERFLGGDSTATQSVKPEYLFLENQGNMKFREKSDPSFSDLGFGWGIVPVDFNLDDEADYLIMQNYIKWAPHKLSKLPEELLEQNSGIFSEKISDYDIENKRYGISALVGDINGDHLDDIIYLNLGNTPNAYLRDFDPNTRFIKIDIPNTAKYLGATLELFAENISLGKKQFLPKQGLMTKQDSSVIFGLNQSSSIPDTLEARLMNGEVKKVDVTSTNIIIK